MREEEEEEGTMRAEEETMIEVAEVEVAIKESVMTITIDHQHQEDGDEVEAKLERKNEMYGVVMMMATSVSKSILTMTIQLKTLSKMIKKLIKTTPILTQKKIIRTKTKEAVEEEVVATEDVVVGELEVGIMTIKIKH